MRTWQDEEYKLRCEVIPSPGTTDREWETIEKKIESMKGYASSIHIDVCDGKFAPNTTLMDPKPFAKYAREFLLEVHLMVDNPLQYLTSYARSGFKRFIGQVEKMPDIPEFIAEAQLLGEVGLAIDKQTPLEAIRVNIDDIDVLLVMTIQAGFSGQAFIPELLEKVSKAREKWPQLPLEVDGGINKETILRAREKGATRFISTSFLFDSQDPGNQFQLLSQVIS